MQYLMYYLLLINAAAFLLMRTDKLRARKKQWRIPEAVLLLFAALGGSLGATAAMFLFRHKTKHPMFLIGFPIMFLLHLGLYLFLI